MFLACPLQSPRYEDPVSKNSFVMMPDPDLKSTSSTLAVMSQQINLVHMAREIVKRYREAPVQTS